MLKNIFIISVTFLCLTTAIIAQKNGIDWKLIHGGNSNNKNILNPTILCNPNESRFLNGTTWTCKCKCDNGNCLGTNECVCKEGFIKLTPHASNCQKPCFCPEYPICSNGNKCYCNKDLIPNISTKRCELTCDDNSKPDYHIQRCVRKSCSCLNENGYCLRSSLCTCYKGYHLTSKKHCEPVCQPKCKNANCIGPNKCECWTGYQHDTIENICVSKIESELYKPKEISITNKCETNTFWTKLLIGVVILMILVCVGLLLYIITRRKRAQNITQNQKEESQATISTEIW